ncbi:MAG: class I fructose-bisphosphate aldolase [Armatimonadota bacterium]
MNGVQVRFGRMLPADRGLVMAALDHGEFYLPPREMWDVGAALEAVTGADAALVSPGTAAHHGGFFSRPAAPHLVVRLNWSTSYCFTFGYGEGRSGPAVTPRHALALGAQAGMVALQLKTGSESNDRDNAVAFAHIVEEAQQVGLPVIGEAFPPRDGSMGREELHEYVMVTSRICCELGAVAVKTFYTGERFGEVVAAAQVPVFALGGEKCDTVMEALKLAEKAFAAGARGVVFGRNILQHDRPAKVTEALKALARGGIGAAAAWKEVGGEKP